MVTPDQQLAIYAAGLVSGITSALVLRGESANAAFLEAQAVRRALMADPIARTETLDEIARLLDAEGLA